MAKVLIVDDSAFARNVIGKLIEEGGHEVVGYADSAKSAVKLFKSLDPELVALDYLMAGDSGTSALRDIIKHNPKARIVMISGSGDSTVEEEARKFGAVDFVEKACMHRDLLKVIDRAMAD